VKINFVKIGFLLVFTFSIFLNAAEKRDAEKEVFSKWLEAQTVIPQMNITAMQNEKIENIYGAVKAQCNFNCNMLKTTLNVFGLIPDKSFVEGLNVNDKYIDYVQFNQTLKNIYGWLQNDVDKFVQYLSQVGVAGFAASREEEQISNDLIADKYWAIFQHLFGLQDMFKQYYYLFTVANNFFEYCFSEKSFSKFKELLIDQKENHSITRLLYCIIWKYLASIGWKHWHQDSINNLKEAAKKGHEIVYVAGGSDIYQLIKNGIYNVKVIDPILPTQPEYYSEGWIWLWKGSQKDGGIGDEIEFNFKDSNIVMKRVYFKEENETFKAMLSNGYEVEIAKSITKWDVLNSKTKRKLGTVTIDRRLTNQNDFSLSSKQTLLISFNELDFIARPVNLGGWGIDPNQFDDKLSIVVKQLCKPVSNQIVRNMRTIDITS